MKQATNQLVERAKRLAIPAAIVGAFALGAAFFVGHGNVHAASGTAAMPIDDNSVEALTSLDRAMEAVAARVTPAGLASRPATVLRATSLRTGQAPGTADRARRRQRHHHFA